MLKMTRPAYSAAEIYDAAVSTINNEADRKRYEAESFNVKAAARKLEKQWGSSRGHRIPTRHRTLITVDVKEMRRMYEYRLRGKRYDTRDYYDAIRLSADNNVCPYCGERRIATLDHYLPQALYSSLSLCADNLVPSCSDCNRLKKHYEPTATEPALLHPYFDKIDQYDWLKVEVTWSHERKPVVRFKVDQSALPAADASRIRRQFELLELDDLYRSHAGQKLGALRRRLPKVFLKGGSRAVRIHLAEQVSNTDYGWRNSWEQLLYKALLADNYYCRRYFA
jgi:5-methylcytosine-specific restriction endonuclease McrA